MKYTNSPLVVHTKLSPNHSGQRTQKIDTITIHCVVGHASIEALGNWFASPLRKASSNYGVDDHGRVGMYVEEKNRSWCSSNAPNDQRAITIEVASDTTHPFKITDKALRGVIELCADICKRNNIEKLLWQGNKALIGQVTKQNMTVHRWFSNKSCPGEYIYSKLGYIADETNKLLNRPTPFVSYLVRVNTAVLNYRKGPGTNHPVAGQVKRNEVYTIVEEASGLGAKKWGKLKSGAGWVSLDYCIKR